MRQRASARIRAPRQLLAGALVALVALDCSAAFAEELPAQPLPLLWIEVGIEPTHPLTLQVLSRELRRALTPHHLDPALTPAAPEERVDSNALKLIVLARHGRERGGGRRVLGAASSADRAIWIYYPSVLAAARVTPDQLWRASGDAWRRLGIALARVIAHEIVHVMLPQQPHVRGGLMAPTIDACCVGVPPIDGEVGEALDRWLEARNRRESSG